MEHSDEVVVDGDDGYLYKRLSLQEAKDLCRDVQFYLVEAYEGEYVIDESGLGPADYRLSLSSHLDDWYLGNNFYYIRLDTDKPEYEPEQRSCDHDE